MCRKLAALLLALPCLAGAVERLAPTTLYVDPQSTAAIWVNSHPDDPRADIIRSKLAGQAQAKWFGNWSGDIAKAVGNYVDAAAKRNQTPILVAYNIPGRDCGQYSAGGANSITGYQQWIASFAAAIGQRKAVVILEPDALGQLTCLSAAGQQGRLDALRYAVEQFHQAAPQAYVYLDAGNSAWMPAEVAASRLAQAGIADARGFALNVSNYKTDQSSKAYGDAVNAALQKQQGYTRAYVVDTSRNGNGPLGAVWCDPPGRKIGVTSVVHLGGGQPEMQLWVKAPGNADGCRGKAGIFAPELAEKLIQGN
ncbi:MULTISPECIES: glycoside hydrolase family 6 protein [unclassified Janthinobacterium]|uniref:glycoside hydrolase family 6 protein n=1 Tax=unclassified Janthinobacterium TaxID=2610881 RepID=UPI0016162AC5|nr:MULTISPECIES: glycoside hydrolase family 6 protein [unclassified Janthinobacterium]MBB5610013.1 endoglucanase [Janthinobacterium sp. S3T4]MBB5615353.1 endoglucanase [Janthinobacterium sp. S3M3]